jgi:hypothetical protein
MAAALAGAKEGKTESQVAAEAVGAEGPEVLTTAPRRLA